MALTTRLLRQLSLKDRQTSITSISSQDDEDIDKWGYFAILPVSEFTTTVNPEVIMIMQWEPL